MKNKVQKLKDHTDAIMKRAGLLNQIVPQNINPNTTNFENPATENFDKNPNSNPAENPNVDKPKLD